MHENEFVPGSEEELSSLLARFSRDGRPVLPVGGGSHLHVGVTPDPCWARVSLASMTGLVFHEAQDLVASFRAGTRLDEVQEVLGKRKQRLPLDPAHGPSTLGGCLGVDHSGILSHRFGTLRDLVLGMTVVLADGRIIRVGGRVVKNVAGYDLSKIMIGSLGTLGMMTEVIVKVVPEAETEAMFVRGFEDISEAWETALRINGDQLEPSSLFVAGAEAARAVCAREVPGKAFVFMGATGVTAFVSGHERHLNQDHAGTGRWVRIEAEEARDVTKRLPPFFSQGSPLSIRFGCRTGLLGEALSRFGQDSGWVVQPGSGTGWLRLVSYDLLSDLRSWLEGNGGYAVVWKGPENLRTEEIWGTSRDDVNVMRSLKKALDPRRILSPGRFVGGI